MPRLLLAAQSHMYRTPNTIAHGAHNAWTAVFVGLIPILGLAAIGVMIYAFGRKRGGDEPS
jgi:hypothetical protein